MLQISHINQNGEANMVDISHKLDTERSAIACAHIVLTPKIIDSMVNKKIDKGDVYSTARIAGIQAAKKCADLIPLCHPLPLSKVSIDIKHDKTILTITAQCKTTAKTGVEMEALTAVSVAALTLYDMCKSIDKGIIVTDIRLLEKQGGKSGYWASDD
ncbi:MAG: cyclic pyranopterin monophosphate synthase MoaC [Porticoccaceae bacterium]|nr:cyclic pyranopterin monophosphate synthase MoaC [Porticoccaceae bacterium]